jgi:hypothetical protein
LLLEELINPVVSRVTLANGDICLPAIDGMPVTVELNFDSCFFRPVKDTSIEAFERLLSQIADDKKALAKGP